MSTDTPQPTPGDAPTPPVMAPPPYVTAPPPHMAPPPGAPGPGFPPPPPSASKRPWWRRGFVVAPASFLVGLMFGGAAAAGGEAATTAVKPATTVTVTAPAAEAAGVEETTAAPPPAEDYTPKASDFRVSLSITEKQCFGSAGCNITFRIKPEYVGTSPVPDGKAYTITYQIDGGEDGPTLNSFKLENGTATYDQEEMISVKSSKAKLSAKVTSVLED